MHVLILSKRKIVDAQKHSVKWKDDKINIQLDKLHVKFPMILCECVC